MINFLQQQGLGAAEDFKAQTHGIVRQQALYKAQNYDEAGVSHPEQLDAAQQNLLATVVTSPAVYGFVETILADAGWGLTYDAWAANPPAAEGAILAGVQVWFNFLVRYPQTPPPPPAEPQPTVEGA